MSKSWCIGYQSLILKLDQCYITFPYIFLIFNRDVVKNLMPLIVNVLENLDFAITEAQEMEVEAELLKEDNEQLVTQYEREKNLRKATDQRLLELEDTFEAERKEATVKVGSLTSIVKMFELKAKNSQDHSKFFFFYVRCQGVVIINLCSISFYINE